MKKLNNKGFTLIELLAVVVILAILVAVAVPSVSKYLSSARQSTYVTNARQAVTAVREDVISKGISSLTYYNYTEINNLLETPLKESPYGLAYSDTSYIKVDFDVDGKAIYAICLTDGSNGFEETEEKDLDEATLKTGTSVVCSH